eukprot:12299041-Alexandrium_andersonii.AAC.1
MEITKVGKALQSFFRGAQKKDDQDLRDFNGVFDRQVVHLREIGCHLPAVVMAWNYVDTLQLDEDEQTSLLAS